MNHVLSRLIWPLAVTLFLGCAPQEELRPGPRVQASVAEAARWQVFINRVRGGVYRGYQPLCLDAVRVGQVVEFMNFNPEIPANVTSIAGPATLYSPNLVRPYNYVAADDPANQLCEVDGPSGCAQRPAWSYWRYRFTTPGVYDWVDSNQGTPGRKIVDVYYGTETFVGIDPTTQVASICVPLENGTGCEGICCTNDGECSGGQRCAKGPNDAVGRCQTPAS